MSPSSIIIGMPVSRNTTMRNHIASRLTCTLLLVLCADVHAARYCVNTPLALAIALSLAQSNGENDDILLEIGDYTLGGELQYAAVPSETYDLRIWGGYEPGTDCFVHATSGNSTLDGQNATRQLYVTANGLVDIEDITFANGKAAQFAGGALFLAGPHSIVASNVFLNNQAAATYAAGALYATGTYLVLRSNVFWANSGTNIAAVLLVTDYLAEANNNTVVGNQLVNHTGQGALAIAGTGQFILSNNILWSNELSDIHDQGGGSIGTDYYDNDIGIMTGASAHSQSNTLSVDPQFNGLLSVRLAPTSPLVNVGLDSPFGGTSDGNGYDAAGNPRIVGKHIDLGAYETDVLFRNGFEP